MPNIDCDLLRKTAPRVSGAKGQNQARIIDALSAALADTLKKYGIDSDLRIAHFVAQTCHESDVSARRWNILSKMRTLGSHGRA
jgi:putative chitinase